MTPEEFKQALAELGFNLTPAQEQQFQLYFKLLVEWNEKINLTALTTEADVYEKHFYDSVVLGNYEELDPKGSLCDVGSGAGFPSLPLKIIYPELKVIIVDSLNKRIKVLEDIVAQLGLEDVKLYHARAEEFGQNPEFREQFDCVTARAVARLNILSELCVPLVKVGGKFIALKAKQGQQELVEAQKALKTLGAKYVEVFHFALPISQETRELYIFEKVNKTPKKYPRKPGIPNKLPL